MSGNEVLTERDARRTVERAVGTARDPREPARGHGNSTEGRGADTYGCVDWFDYPPAEKREPRPQGRRDG
jgi:hypothetical protein